MKNKILTVFCTIIEVLIDFMFAGMIITQTPLVINKLSELENQPFKYVLVMALYGAAVFIVYFDFRSLVDRINRRIKKDNEL